MYKTRCFEDSSRCTSDVTPSRLIYNRAKKLLSSISSVGRVTIAWEVPLASSLDSYTSNWRRSLGMFTVSNFEAKRHTQSLSMATVWGQQQTIDFVSGESPEILGLGVEDGHLFAHGGWIGLRSRGMAKTHCSPAATLQYILVYRDWKARQGEAVMKGIEAMRGAVMPIYPAPGRPLLSSVQSPPSFGVTYLQTN